MSGLSAENSSNDREMSTKKKVGIGIFCFFIILLIIGGIGALLGIGSTHETSESHPNIKVNVFKPCFHNWEASLKVTLKDNTGSGVFGFKNKFYITLYGPDNEQVGSTILDSSNENSVWVSMTSKDWASPESGSYRLVVEKSEGGVVYENTFGPYFGPDLQFLNAELKTGHNKITDTVNVQSLEAKVKNNGDLPAWIGSVGYKINSTEENRPIGEPVNPNQTRVISRQFLLSKNFEPGEYSICYQLFNVNDKIIENYSTTIALSFES